jgi:hypothetical protein
MTQQTLYAFLGMLVFCSVSFADSTRLDLTETAGLRLHNTAARIVTFEGREGLELRLSEASEAEVMRLRREHQASGAAGPPPRVDHLAIVADEFGNGTIEVELAGQPAPGAAGGARGFVGIAFRIQGDLATYECIYLRPTNGRADDQERRNHSVQYVSHPDYPWYRLRRETPSRYESYVDLQPGSWTQVRVVVSGATARLFVHGNEQPTLIVNDLKMGADAVGAVALWIEGSTVAHFRDLTITTEG